MECSFGDLWRAPEIELHEQCRDENLREFASFAQNVGQKPDATHPPMDHS
jgi:hypothetical protein